MGQPGTAQDPGATVVRARPHGVPPETARRLDRVKAGLRAAGLPLAAVFVCGLAVSLGGAFAIRGLGRAVLDVPNSFSPLVFPNILPYAVAPIVGSSVAFIVAFIVKKPGPRSRHLFFTVGVKFLLFDGLLAVLNLPSSTSTGSIVTMAAVIVYPLLIIMPALLRFVPRPDSGGIPAVAAV